MKPISATPDDKTELEPSLTPTKASTDKKAVAEEERTIESDSGLSPVQQGASALANLGKPRGSELFRE